MKSLAFILMLFIAFGGISRAQNEQTLKDTKIDKSKKTETVKEAKMVCPVTGEEADPEVSFVHKGTKYYFCCMGCVGKFKKSPAKFIKASAKSSFDPCDDHKDSGKEMKHEPVNPDAPKIPAQQIRFLNTEDSAKGVINTGKDLSAQISNASCPVMSKKVNPKVTTVSYNGKVYGFCCKSCINKFAATPEKYLQKDKEKVGKKVEPKEEPKKL